MAQSLKYNLQNLAIHRDARGWLVEMLKQNEVGQKIAQIYVASLCPGAIRGNHWHSKRIEWFFVIGGDVQVHLQDTKTKKTKIIDIRSDNPSRISIFPPVAHAVVLRHQLACAVAPAYVSDFSCSELPPDWLNHEP